MARKSPVELHRIALYMHRRGHPPCIIADMLGLHAGALQRWLEQKEMQGSKPSLNQPYPQPTRR
ncbi:MAG: hypothetical protein JJU06_19550 [Ectothiorhodospiraceae bacterium]|nr:hypothetical protein [Ectothiorhodospiraceae bacterium]